MEFQTNTTVTETHVQVNLRWDPGYVKTLPGAIKSVVILTNLLGFVCVMVATPYYKEQPVGEWFVFVSMTGFWVSSVLLVMYLVHAMEKFHVIPWLMIEFGFCALWTFFFFAAALAAAVEGPHSAQLGAASFFGFVSMVVYGLDAVLKFRGWRAGQLAQGERKVTQTFASPTIRGGH